MFSNYLCLLCALLGLTQGTIFERPCRSDVTVLQDFQVDKYLGLCYPDVDILEAKLNVSFYGAPNDESNYWVLDTDYENYALVWSCEPIGEERSLEYYWLLSRTPTMPEDEELRDKIAERKQANGIVDDELIITEHFAEGCKNKRHKRLQKKP
uniref:Lipocalin/cytosolic fatty-acid binding domain-containing protein n=1 Tax=Anopheles atroparvus TaxID=41427 RepID=A0A182J5D9_ANOAO